MCTCLESKCEHLRTDVLLHRFRPPSRNNYFVVQLLPPEIFPPHHSSQSVQFPFQNSSRRENETLSSYSHFSGRRCHLEFSERRGKHRKMWCFHVPTHVSGFLHDVLPANGEGKRDLLDTVWNGARYLVHTACPRRICPARQRNTFAENNHRDFSVDILSQLMYVLEDIGGPACIAM